MVRGTSLEELARGKEKLSVTLPNPPSCPQPSPQALLPLSPV